MDVNALVVWDTNGIVVGYVEKSKAEFLSPLWRHGFFEKVELRVKEEGKKEEDEVEAELVVSLELERMREFGEEKRPPVVGEPVKGFQKASTLVAARKNNGDELYEAHKKMRAALREAENETLFPKKKKVEKEQAARPSVMSRFVTSTKRVKPEKENEEIAEIAIPKPLLPKKAKTTYATVECLLVMMKCVKWEEWLAPRDILFGIRCTAKHIKSALDSSVFCRSDFVRNRQCHFVLKSLKTPDDVAATATATLMTKPQLVTMLKKLQAPFPLPNDVLAAKSSTERLAVVERLFNTVQPKWRAFEIAFAILCYLQSVAVSEVSLSLKRVWFGLHDELVQFVSLCSTHNANFLTTEQEQVLQRCNFTLAGSTVIRVSALAGSGKTTLLKEIAKANSSSKILYLCFNKSVQEESSRRFPPNVECRTIHSLAFKETGYKAFACAQSDDFDAVKRWWCADARNNSQTDGVSVTDRASRTSSSQRDDVEEFSDSTINDLFGRLRVFVNSTDAFPATRDVADLWVAMQRGEVPMTYSGVVKECALKNVPLEQYAMIMLDEAQDCNPAALEIVLKQSHALRILVGDANQAIYGFMDATNAMKSLQSYLIEIEDFNLTRSFRMGPVLAQAVTTFLRLSSNSSYHPIVVGAGCLANTPWLGRAVQNETPSQFCTRVQSLIRGRRASACFVSRTNVSCLEMAVECLKSNARMKIAFVGGLTSARVDDLKDMTEFIKRSNPEEGGSSTSGKKFKPKFYLLQRSASVEAFYHACMVRGLQEWTTLVNTVKRWGLDRACEVIRVLESSCERGNKRVVPNLEEADLVFSTVHRVKGLEFDGVYVGDDFEVDVSTPRRFAKMDEETRNLLYVAFTRAKSVLVFNAVLENTTWIYACLVPFIPRRVAEVQPLLQAGQAVQSGKGGGGSRCVTCEQRVSKSAQAAVGGWEMERVGGGIGSGRILSGSSGCSTTSAAQTQQVVLCESCNTEISNVLCF